MTWEIEYTDEFGNWWGSLNEDEQESVAAYVRLLEMRGTADKLYDEHLQTLREEGLL